MDEDGDEESASDDDDDEGPAPAPKPPPQMVPRQVMHCHDIVVLWIRPHCTTSDDFLSSKRAALPKRFPLCSSAKAPMVPCKRSSCKAAVLKHVIRTQHKGSCC